MTKNIEKIFKLNKINRKMMHNLEIDSKFKDLLKNYDKKKTFNKKIICQFYDAINSSA